MSALALAVAAATSAQSKADPVLWLTPRGSLQVAGRSVNPRLSPGTQVVRTPVGLGIDFTGRRSGVLLDDLDPLKVTGSITISTWVYLRNYAISGYQAQILFRGDDRDGVDAYSLCVKPNGTAEFRMDDPDGKVTALEADVKLRQWTHITASFDGGTGEMKVWIGDRLISTRIAPHRIFTELDRGQTPGVSLGNVQNDRGRHNQPLDGILADLRLYNAVLEPNDAGYRGGSDRIAP